MGAGVVGLAVAKSRQVKVEREAIKRKPVTNIDLVNEPAFVGPRMLGLFGDGLRGHFDKLGHTKESVVINQHESVAVAIKLVTSDSLILFPVTNKLKDSQIISKLEEFFRLASSPVLLVVPGWNFVQKVCPTTIAADVAAFTERLRSPVKNLDSSSLERVILDFATENKARNLLKEKLQAYVNEVESHTDAQGNTSYRYNLSLFFADHQAHNRQANYELAKELLEKLTKSPHSNIATVFADLDKQKEKVMKEMPSSWSRPYFSVAIRGHLAEIRKIAEDYIKKSGEQPVLEATTTPPIARQ